MPRPEPRSGEKLDVPCADDRELIMDILKHGRHVKVLAPAELAQRVREEHLACAEERGGAA